MLLPLLWNLTKTLKQLGASHHFHPRDPSKWLPLPTTLSLIDLGPCRTQHFFPYFDELEQWLGEVNTAVNVSCQWPCFSSLWQSSPQRMPYGPWPNLGQPRSDTTDLWGGASPALTLRHCSPSDLHSLRFMLTALHAQITAGKGCPLQFCKTTSFPWDRDESLIDHHVKLLQRTFSHSECSGTWTWPEMQGSIHHTSASHAIPFALTSQMLCPCASYWEHYACSSAVSKTQGKDIKN